MSKTAATPRKIAGKTNGKSNGKQRRAVRLSTVRARFDAATTNDENRRHWANADALGPDAALTASVRRTLRNRARYEVANNSYARGIVLTLANDTIGTGPRLQMLTDNDNVNQRVEREFARWSQEMGLAENLRTMRMARCQDGEAFAILANNPALDHPVKLDMLLVEADQVTSAFDLSSNEDDDGVDGIKLDKFGNPISYDVLKEHPGANTWTFGQETLTIPAASMIHLLRRDRPGQHRGIPELLPALPLFAHMRRYTLAVIMAAETAATFAGILYTDAPADDGSSPAPALLDAFELERNTLTTMPDGWKMNQLEPAQPSTAYAEFKKEILNEIARCLNMPFNVAAGNSSDYNYASGRMDHQVYFKSIRVDQGYIARKALDHILSAWLWEAALEFGLFRGIDVSANGRMLPPHQWFWDGIEHVDPAKEAAAQTLRLKNQTTTLAHEYARQGKDWEAELRQLAREKELKAELGLTGSTE